MTHRENAEQLRTACLLVIDRLARDACQDVTRPMQRMLREAVAAFDVAEDATIHGCICPSHASNRGECPVHDEKGRPR